MNDSHQKHPYWKGMECAQLLSDARFLMRDYHIPISLSALQVYHRMRAEKEDWDSFRATTNHKARKWLADRNDYTIWSHLRCKVCRILIRQLVDRVVLL
jgi:hypothetical protein